MARKHRKTGITSRPVERTLITPEVKERKIVQGPSGDYEVQHIVTPAVYKQGKAAGSTTSRGNKNAPPETKKSAVIGGKK